MGVDSVHGISQPSLRRLCGGVGGFPGASCGWSATASGGPQPCCVHPNWLVMNGQWLMVNGCCRMPTYPSSTSPSLRIFETRTVSAPLQGVGGRQQLWKSQVWHIVKRGRMWRSRALLVKLWTQETTKAAAREFAEHLRGGRRRGPTLQDGERCG